MIEFWAIEIQNNADGTGACVGFGFANKGDCEGKYLALREYARQSNVPVHPILFIDSKGNRIEKPVVYEHPQQSAPQPE